MKKLVKSHQRNVMFIFCASPITIDKSAEWGSGNLQLGPNGAFLKVNESDTLTISHMVQPNEDKTAPIGWVPTSEPNFFDKAPIWIETEGKPAVGFTVPVQTKDGPINYTVTEPSTLCYNDLNGAPDLNDSWIQKDTELAKNYAI